MLDPEDRAPQPCTVKSLESLQSLLSLQSQWRSMLYALRSIQRIEHLLKIHPPIAQAIFVFHHEGGIESGGAGTGLGIKGFLLGEVRCQ